MSSRLAVAGAVLCGCLAAVPGALGGRSADPGITPASIPLGGTAPLTPPSPTR